MWPTTQAKIFLFEQRRWRESRDGDRFDSKVISELSIQVNDLKAALLKSEQVGRNALKTLGEAADTIVDLRGELRDLKADYEQALRAGQ